MIDLHSHTYYSDGTFSPEELLDLAARIELRALAITDHDTLSGYDHAASLPRPQTLELLCGIEITCRLETKAAHLLGYFLKSAPNGTFRAWLDERQEQRRDRNRRLVRKLQECGLEIELEEVEALGRSMTGRPHFARILVQKGYATDIEDAFQRFIGEEARAFVFHEAPTLEQAITRVDSAGGIASLAHPLRLNLSDEKSFFTSLASAGMHSLEAFHTDHNQATTQRYLEFAKDLNMKVTGGSDFHGAVKPRVQLGGANVEDWVLQKLRESN